MKRLLVPEAAEGSLTLDPSRAHHLVHVLRVAPADSLEIFDGAGSTFEARVMEVRGDGSVTLTLTNRRTQPSDRVITIIQGLPKGDKLELVIQKATELGANTVIPAACERSVVHLEGKALAKQARWQKIADEAARQSGRADRLEVGLPTSLLEAVRALPSGTQVLVLDEEERERPLSLALGAGSLALVIGPEGGLARGEVEQLRALGAVSVTLGRLVLRTETAALAALAVIRHLDGRLG